MGTPARAACRAQNAPWRGTARGRRAPTHDDGDTSCFMRPVRRQKNTGCSAQIPDCQIHTQICIASMQIGGQVTGNHAPFCKNTPQYMHGRNFRNKLPLGAPSHNCLRLDMCAADRAAPNSGVAGSACMPPPAPHTDP